MVSVMFIFNEYYSDIHVISSRVIVMSLTFEAGGKLEGNFAGKQ